MSFYFVPDDFVLTDELRDFARNLGLTDGQIDEQEDKWRDHQYKSPRKCAVRCWRNWIRNAIKFGDAVPAQNHTLRTPETLSDEQRAADVAAAWRDMNKLRGVK